MKARVTNVLCGWPFDTNVCSHGVYVCTLDDGVGRREYWTCGEQLTERDDLEVSGAGLFRSPWFSADSCARIASEAKAGQISLGEIEISIAVGHIVPCRCLHTVIVLMNLMRRIFPSRFLSLELVETSGSIDRNVQSRDTRGGDAGQ